ncbi:hypothetical protein Asp14428_33070 [Actinoplanes sp. NBRC 14428]|nr:hypothetical protein Asp14428_33070 [Actinoplanes sp. NBRC 14428]
MSWVWPFPDDEAFWTWAMDPDAELSDQDEDLLLHALAGLPLLVAAADRPDCPKDSYCCSVLEHYAALIIRRGHDNELAGLRAAATQAAAGVQVHTRRFAAYAERLLGYLTPHGPVTRAMAEQLTGDLLSSPSQEQRALERGQPTRLTVQVTANGKQWQCTHPGFDSDILYINRRTGMWRLSYRRPLSADELAQL